MGSDWLLGLHDNNPDTLTNRAIDNYVDSFLCLSEFYNDQLCLEEEFEHNCQYSKRQKLQNNNGFIPPYSDVMALNYPPLPPIINTHYNPIPDHYLPDFLVRATTTNFETPGCNVLNQFGNGGAESFKKPSGFSAQSVAARQRRRKITEKTQELGKLIPGGNRMHTAEMFHAAYKYIKFMQAQVAMLELSLGLIQEDSEADNENLRVLLSSSIMHEKLYSEEKCLVPNKLVEVLVSNQDIGSDPVISKQISLLVSPNC